MKKIKRIGIVNGDGDFFRLNSIIYGILLKAFEAGIECHGILKGWKGLLEKKTILVNIVQFNNLHVNGASIINSSEYNPIKESSTINSKEEYERFEERILKNLVEIINELKFDALIAIGGENTF